MSDSSTDLATLIGSRICHDLISPIGAINNGLELLDLAGSTNGPELELISDSVVNAGARIQFFRIAYGAAGEQELGRSDIVPVLRDVARGARMRVYWAPDKPLPRKEVRLAFLGLQCFETALPYGGTVDVSVADGKWTLSGKGDKIAVDPRLWGRIDGSCEGGKLTPALVQFGLFPQIARELDRTPRVKAGTTVLTLEF